MNSVTNIDISKIKPYEKNPRKNDNAIDKVANSIKEFGFKQPIVVDKEYTIIAGHTRYQGANKLQLKEVPIIVADDLTPEQVKAYRIADNRVAQESEWDYDLLKIEFEELQEIDYNLLETGFDQKELDEMLQLEVEGLTDEDEVPEPPVEPITKLGDIWQLGNHRLMCGDSTMLDNIDKLTEKHIHNKEKESVINSVFQRVIQLQSYDKELSLEIKKFIKIRIETLLHKYPKLNNFLEKDSVNKSTKIKDIDLIKDYDIKIENSENNYQI